MEVSIKAENRIDIRFSYIIALRIPKVVHAFNSMIQRKADY